MKPEIYSGVKPKVPAASFAVKFFGATRFCHRSQESPVFRCIFSVVVPPPEKDAAAPRAKSAGTWYPAGQGERR